MYHHPIAQFKGNACDSHPALVPHHSPPPWLFLYDTNPTSPRQERSHTIVFVLCSNDSTDGPAEGNGVSKDMDRESFSS